MHEDDPEELEEDELEEELLEEELDEVGLLQRIGSAVLPCPLLL